MSMDGLAKGHGDLRLYDLLLPLDKDQDGAVNQE
jgi:hypothetical protein